MINNALNRDTVYYVGMLNEVWQTTEVICERLNREGFYPTIAETESILASLAANGKALYGTVEIINVYGDHETWKAWRKLVTP